MNQPKLIDLFCGAGGMSLGAARAGYSIAASVDLDEKALSAHVRNFPNTTHLLWDLSKTTGAQVLEAARLKHGEVDVVVGGPPCQGFSSIGKKNPSDVRNELIGHFFRIVREIGPRAFVMENVPGVLAPQYEPLLQGALAQVADQYDIAPPQKIRAIDAGAPTTRTRVLIVGFKRGEKQDIARFWGQVELRKQIAPVVKYSLDGLPFDIHPDPTASRKGVRTVRVTRNGFFFASVVDRVPAGVGDPRELERYFARNLVTGCLGTAHSAELLARYAALKWGEQDKKTKSVRLNPNGYCPTLRAGTSAEKGSFQAVRPIHYVRPRVITPREAARLQGFPDWYQFDATKWHSFRQIGNSVSPLVAELVLSQISDNLMSAGG
jgi:DNA (cytosine-5)-methyltransferase 1